MSGQVIVVAEAYPRKAELGGGYRGFAVDRGTKQRLDGGVHPTLEAARNEAKRLAWSLLGDRAKSTTCGYVYGKTSWRCNYWGSP